MAGHPRLRAVLREPLLHFLLIGGALFAIDALRGEPEDGERRIVVSDLVRRELATRWEDEHGAPPSRAELDRAVDGWVSEEVLYREGLARGLGQDDPQVRARVASQMEFVLRSQAVVPDPTGAELRAWFDAHRNRFAEGTRVSFTHVFVEGDDAAAEARANELLAVLRGGASPAGLGDRFSGGRRYRQREMDDLARTFGEAFVRGLDEQPVGSWALRRSRFGLHLVRVDEIAPAHAADFDDVREDVRGALREERRNAIVAEKIADLRRRWDVVR